MLLSSICRNASKAISPERFQQSAVWTVWAAQWCRKTKSLAHIKLQHSAFPSLFPMTCYCSLLLWFISSHSLCEHSGYSRMGHDDEENLLFNCECDSLWFKPSFLKYVEMNQITVSPCSLWCLPAASCVVFCLLGYSSIWWSAEEMTLCFW